MKTDVLETKELLAEFNHLKRCRYKNVPGVKIVDSGVRGPTVGVTINTHGNEPSGLAVSHFLRTIYRLEDRLSCGRVLIVLNNPLATERFFGAKDETQKRAARLVDLNMNRLPASVLTDIDDKRYEARRARELRPAWMEFDAGIDIHSTSEDTLPMIITVGQFQRELVKDFPIHTVISNIDRVQIGKPACAFYGDYPRTPVVGIEAGQHEKQSSFDCAVACSLAFFRALGLLAKQRRKIARTEHVVYRVEASLMFPDKSFRLERLFKGFEVIKKGDILAKGDKGRMLRAPFDGHILFGPSSLTSQHLNEEVLFFSAPKQTF